MLLLGDVPLVALLCCLYVRIVRQAPYCTQHLLHINTWRYILYIGPACIEWIINLPLVVHLNKRGQHRPIQHISSDSTSSLINWMYRNKRSYSIHSNDCHSRWVHLWQWCSDPEATFSTNCTLEGLQHINMQRSHLSLSKKTQKEGKFQFQPRLDCAQVACVDLEGKSRQMFNAECHYHAHY